jgi:predicted DNA binding protein
MMKRIEQYFDVVANDEKKFFCTALQHFNELNLEVIVWGKIPIELTRQLLQFKKKKLITKLRKNLFRENTYIVNADQNLEFVAICNQLDFKNISWGIFEDDGTIIFARSKDDINVSSTKNISFDMIKSLLEKLNNERIIEKFEIIEEEEEL